MVTVVVVTVVVVTVTVTALPFFVVVVAVVYGCLFACLLAALDTSTYTGWWWCSYPDRVTVTITVRVDTLILLESLRRMCWKNSVFVFLSIPASSVYHDGQTSRPNERTTNRRSECDCEVTDDRRPTMGRRNRKKKNTKRFCRQRRRILRSADHRRFVPFFFPPPPPPPPEAHTRERTGTEV